MLVTKVCWRKTKLRAGAEKKLARRHILTQVYAYISYQREAEERGKVHVNEAQGEEICREGN